MNKFASLNKEELQALSTLLGDRVILGYQNSLDSRCVISEEQQSSLIIIARLCIEVEAQLKKMD